MASVPAARPLTAVIHTAAVLDDGVITELTPARTEAVLRPKAAAAAELHRLTAGADLAAFVLFSSSAGTLGAAGQGNYAAANTYLDALAAAAPRRRAAGGVAGLGHVGPAQRADRPPDQPGHYRIGRAGMTPLTTAQGLALFDTATGLDEALAVLARIDPPARLGPLLADSGGGPARRTARPPPPAAPAISPPASPPCPPPPRTSSCWTWSAPRPPWSSATPHPKQSTPPARSATWASTP